jgi:hypothetical protein
LKFDFSEDIEVTYLFDNVLSDVATPTYSLTESRICLTIARRLPPIYYVGINCLKEDEKEYNLTKPIFAVVCYQNGLYSMENKDLTIITMSADYDQCLNDFKDEVLFIIEEYATKDDGKLANDAKELKRRINQYINK